MGTFRLCRGTDLAVILSGDGVRRSFCEHRSVPISPKRLIAAALAGILIACLAAAFLQLLPRFELGGSIEGVQWVQAAGAMFWALPVTLCGITGAGAGYAIATLTTRSRMLTAAFAGTGAVLGVAAFVAVGTPWYEVANGIAAESFGLAAAAFFVCAGLYRVASIRRSAPTRPPVR